MGDENDKRIVDLALVDSIRSGQRNDTLVTIGILILIIMLASSLIVLMGNMSI